MLDNPHPPRIEFDLYQVYKGRVPRLPDSPVASWNIPSKVLQQQLADSFGTVASAYVERPQTERVLLQQPLSIEPDVSMIVTHIPRRVAVEQDTLQFHLTCGLDTVAEFNLLQLPSRWDIRHRLVHPAYRGNRIFSAMTAGLESFIQSYADRTMTRQKIEAETGQPTVMARFYNRGYRFESVEEEEVFWRIMEGHPEYYCAYAWKNEMAAAFEEPDIFKDVYCFNRETTLVEQEGEAARLTLHRCIHPRPQATHVLQQATAAQVRQTGVDL